MVRTRAFMRATLAAAIDGDEDAIRLINANRLGMFCACWEEPLRLNDVPLVKPEPEEDE